MSNNIETSGGIFTHHFIDSIEQERANHPALKADSFTFTYQDRISERELEARIAFAWEDLVLRWDVIEREFGALDITLLRQRWLRPLFGQLGFNLEFNRADIVLDEEFRFPISFLGRAGVTEFTIPVHTVLYNPTSSLDVKSVSGRGIKAMAPHDMLQRYLNLSKEHKWGLLTDGVNLRLLRDYYHSYTRGYTEFDLQSIFSTRDYAGFRAMYRLLHASRFAIPQGKETPPIEEMYEDALAMGVAVGNKLRENVQAAIETLANGFLVSSPTFMATIRNNPEGSAQLYRDILVTIYRILFLLFAEQRGMLPGRGTLYHDEFSLTAFRTLAEQLREDDGKFDLWEKLKTTFHMVEHGVPALKIFPYNGALFSMARSPLLTPKKGPEAPRCRNDYFLAAIRHLTTVEQDGVLQRISYSDLSVEEIGSIYESLLEITPRISDANLLVDNRKIMPNTFYLDPRGKGRKTSGSYYTPPSLVNELIKSALEPVLLSRLQESVPGYDSELVEALSAEESALAEKALLKIKVVDPAAGSGAFLIAANNKLGLELARIRSGSLFPPQKEIQRARRDVLTHCIHGVDLNPMAVELCKVSLWINAAVEDAPLNFLDHHIQCGNSLVGATPALIKGGIPDEAYNPLTGDEKAIASSLKKRNRQARQGQDTLPYHITFLPNQAALQKWISARDMAETAPAIAEKAFIAYQTSSEKWDARLPYDLFCAAFFTPLREGQPVPTTQDLRQAIADPRLVPIELKQLARQLAEEHRFFHWHLAFPQVFDEQGQGGFDVVLGNPPWERVKLQEKEFFEGKDESIVEAPNASVRKRAIAELETKNSTLWRLYSHAMNASESESNFFHNSNSYPLAGRGDINLYQVFAERMRILINPVGRSGIIVPTGIATDDTCKFLFAELVEKNQIASLFDFENRKKLFADIDSRMKFSLLTLRGSASQNEPSAQFAFFLYHPNDLNDDEKVFNLSAEDFALLNPNTRTCPIFRSKTDASLTRKLYQQGTVLKNDEDKTNPLNVTFGSMFHSMNDASLLLSEDYFLTKKYQLDGNRYFSTSETYHPLVEGKSFMQFDHRFADVVISDTATARPAQPVNITNIDHENPFYLPKVRAWVNEFEINEWKKQKGHNLDWFVVYKKITSSTNERTSISTIIPESPMVDTVHILIPNESSSIQEYANIVCLFNSFVFDYICRQKLGGNSLSFYVLSQIPSISMGYQNIKNFISVKLFELVYTSWDMIEFASCFWSNLDNYAKSEIQKSFEQNLTKYLSKYSTLSPPDWLFLLSYPYKKLTFNYPPVIWDDDRRFQLRCDLDALFGHLYNLTRDEFDYILETFPIVKRNDEAQHGEYRTKRVILEKFDCLADDPMLQGACIPLRDRVSVLKNPPQPHTQPQSQPEPQARPIPAAPMPPANPEPQTLTQKSNPPAQIREGQPPLFQVQSSKDTPADPKPTDYTLYRCPLCDKHLVGYALEEHTHEVHQGQNPGYRKLGK